VWERETRRELNHEKPTNYTRGLAYQAENLAAAKIILADVERYGGPDGSMAKWANMQVNRCK